VATGDGTTVTSETATESVTAGSTDLDVIEVKLPDGSKLIDTEAWGRVPANQVCVILADGKTRKDADQVAKALGGTVVGELEYLNAYQVETIGVSEAHPSSLPTLLA